VFLGSLSAAWTEPLASRIDEKISVHKKNEGVALSRRLLISNPPLRWHDMAWHGKTFLTIFFNRPIFSHRLQYIANNNVGQYVIWLANAWSA
jgi:hypothetical protein